MSIRLRTVSGVRVALCAVESDPQPDDVYLDDADHAALGAKFARDHAEMGFIKPELLPLWSKTQAGLMDSQKVRDAREVFDEWERAGRP